MTDTQFINIDYTKILNIEDYFEKKAFDIAQLRDYFLAINTMCKINIDSSANNDIEKYIVDFLYKIIEYAFNNPGKSTVRSLKWATRYGTRSDYDYGGTCLSVDVTNNICFQVMLDLLDGSLGTVYYSLGQFVSALPDLISNEKYNNYLLSCHNVISMSMDHYIDEYNYCCENKVIFNPLFATYDRASRVYDALRDKIKENKELYIWLYFSSDKNIH